MDVNSNHKRPYSENQGEHGSSPKRIKPSVNVGPEQPEVYSDAVRRKLSSASRTGQACDRCKERKMKCDTNPVACGPCHQKKLGCFTTDRVTGKAFERGQSDRLEGEIHTLRRQVQAYQRKYGALSDEDTADDGIGISTSSTSQVPTRQQYVPPQIFQGIDGDDLHTGPVNGTLVDIFDGAIDIADFDCPDMQEYDPEELGRFTTSKTSMVNTMCGRQRIGDPRPPSRSQALEHASHFNIFIWPYVPIVHRKSFIELIKKFYDQPIQKTSPAEQAMIYLVLAIITQQSAIRNPSDAKERTEESNRWLHYALGFYPRLYHDKSLASLQALTFMIIHARNLPKPGFSWVLSHTVLVRAIEMNYHRSPDKIDLPDEHNNPLGKELRKRVFWSILGICVTIGTKIGKPAPWHFTHLDCPVPLAIRDDEVSEAGISPHLSGKCDFWVALQLFKLLPLLTELYNDVISTRKPPNEYSRTVELLNSKILAWKQDWQQSIAVESKDGNLEVMMLHVETWAAEYQLVLHHAKLCTARSPEVSERNMEICVKAARALLSSFQLLSNRFKGADFTWHSTVAYALGFGATLQYFKARPDYERFDAVKNELSGWRKVMAVADTVLRTGNYLSRIFEPRVRELENQYQNHQSTSSSYNGYQKSPLNSVNQTHQRPDEAQSSPVKSQYSPQIKYDSSNPSPNVHSAQQSYIRTLTTPHQQQQQQSNQPFHSVPQHQQSPYHNSPYNSYPQPPQSSMIHPPPAYPAYSMPQAQFPPQQYQSPTPIPQSLATILNESPNGPSGQALYMYSTTSAGQVPNQQAEAFMNMNLMGFYSEGNWPHMIMEDPSRHGMP